MSDLEEHQLDGHNEARNRKKRPRVIEWDERDRLLSPSGGGNARSSYMHPDDPAVSPNLILGLLRHVSSSASNERHDYFIRC